MGNTEDEFGKKRDHNQYGEVEKNKNEKDKTKNTELPKPPNKASENKKEE